MPRRRLDAGRRQTVGAAALVLLALAACEHAPEREQPAAIELPTLAFCDDVRDWPEPWIERERELAEQLGDARELGGRCGTLGVFVPAEPTLPDGALQCAARKHALDMSAREYFAHADPDGANAVVRMDEAGYVAELSTELIAAGDVAAETVTDVLWLASDAHCAALLAPEWRRAGVGFVADDSDRGAFWVVVLATEPR